MKTKIILILLFISFKSFGQLHLEEINSVQARTMQGKEVNLIEYANNLGEDKPVIIITASIRYCQPCYKIIESLNQKYNESSNFEFTALVYNNSFSKFQKYANIEYNNLYHNSASPKSFSKITGASVLPIILITYKGKIIYYKSGWGKYNYKDLVNLLDSACYKIMNSAGKTYPSISGLEKFVQSKNGYVKKIYWPRTRDVYQTGRILNNKKEGLWKDYWPNGELSHMTFYIEGKKQDGEQKMFHNNGQIFSIGLIKNGEKDGLWKYFHENGELKNELQYQNGYSLGEYKEYHDNGVIAEVGYFTKNGEKQVETGDWKTYHKNGKLESKGEYEDGKKNGKWVTYFEDGELESTGKYLKGNETGIWKVGEVLGDDFNPFYDIDEFPIKLSDIGKYIYTVGKMEDVEFVGDNLKVTYDTGEEIMNIQETEQGYDVSYYYKNGSIMLMGKYDSDENTIGIWKVYNKKGRVIYKEKMD